MTTTMSKNQIQTLKGFRDFLPAEALQRDWLKQQIVKVFEAWGYDPLETPTLEPLELFTGQIGEDEKLFFQFEDQGGRKVALRYDQTVPTCRVVGANYQNLPMPFRRYQIQPAFRAEKPQKGRYREFVQCDADIFGVAEPTADAETIALGLDIYRQLGFSQAIVLINDRKLLRDIPYQAISAIDKLNKIGPDGVIRDMETKGIETSRAREYLEFVTQKLQPNETITIILNYLKNLGFDESWFRFEPTIARSFSYSDGPIWEIEIPNFSGGSVLGGERFDGLTQKTMGVTIPATGFGLGFDRTLEAAIELGLAPSFSTKTNILISTYDSPTLPYSLATASQLRAAGINTEVYPSLDKLPKQLKYANKKQIPFVAILGPEEASNQTLTLKNMQTGEQLTTSLENAIEHLAK